jgi:hypothetical protein
MLGEDWNSIQLRKALVEEYPYLLPRNSFTGEPIENYDYSFIEGEYNLPEGWMELFLQCCEDIREPLVRADYLNKFRFLQIKEKWGYLTMYSRGATDEVYKILSKYRFLSGQICSVCGKPATVRTYGYVCPYCSEHVRGSMENIDDAELIELKTSFEFERWNGNGYFKEILDCTDEWNRYLERIGYIDL